MLRVSSLLALAPKGAPAPREELAGPLWLILDLLSLLYTLMSARISNNITTVSTDKAMPRSRRMRAKQKPEQDSRLFFPHRSVLPRKRWATWEIKYLDRPKSKIRSIFYVYIYFKADRMNFTYCPPQLYGLAHVHVHSQAH
jgi:hypothetical protein